MSAEGEQKNYWRGDSEEEEASPVVAPEPVQSDESIVNWSASEYISPDKNFLWYVILIIVALGLISLDVFIMRAWTFSALVVVMTVSIIVYSRRPPREVQYTLSADHGLYIGEKLRSLSEFKSFGLINDGTNYSVILVPVKRFSPGVSVFFPEEVGEAIINILGARLPMEKLKLDFIDQLIRRLRI